MRTVIGLWRPLESVPVEEIEFDVKLQDYPCAYDQSLVVDVSH